MKKLMVNFILLLPCLTTFALPPVSLNSAEILLRLKKLNVLGSILYIAAHPDDENTRLLAYLANEKLYRTGYLSITRGDGGQNLIGDEQGAELGLIRTQELLAARRIDGAEQFFTRAYDFGFSKSTDEALDKWNKSLVLGDVVWVIRKFQPDVIITRFPEDSRAGHGHHSASAVLAHEAFLAAADPTQYPEQLKLGVRPWKAKRLLWNTFNFGGNNTQSDDQFKVDVGGYNTLLGKSYGEIAAESRSQHKSQGFGVAAQRGSAWEYFLTVAGDAPKTDLMDGVQTGWERTASFGVLDRLQLPHLINSLIDGFSIEHPEKSVDELVKLYRLLSNEKGLSAYWREQKLKELSNLVQSCSGLFIEATSGEPFVTGGDSLPVSVNLVNRGGLKITARIASPFIHSFSGALPINKLISFTQTIFVPVSAPLTQPYWLKKGLNDGHFIVDDQQLIGLPESPPAFEMTIAAAIDQEVFFFSTPVQYKYTDPVRGEVYQPLSVVPAISLNETPKFVFTRLNRQPALPIQLSVTAFSPLFKNASAQYFQYAKHGGEVIRNRVVSDTALSLRQNDVVNYTIDATDLLQRTREKELRFIAALRAPLKEEDQRFTVRRIEYAHIPAITYFQLNEVKVIDDEIITAGKKVGYITGAGDKVPDALREMGYEVTFLSQNDVLSGNLSDFDAIVIGVRAYNVHEWLNKAHESLMNYVRIGGNLVVQYNTRNFTGPLNAKIGPYPFEISRGRVTDENAKVRFLQPKALELNWPNKIGSNDFDGWVQERGIYFAGENDKAYENILAMKDPGEQEQQGSLIVSRYGKGRFIYTGLVFFRQLPAGIGGAYRLFANLVANPNLQKINGTAKKE
ncbi:MAG: PIG-L family deacetylase [Chitinophagaceae bacterium]|nr:PIG-L family deacetylase [Chitinophagaceae bacterium]